MTCDEARTAMLEADPATLRSETDDALGVHLRSCERCAAVARVLVAELDALDAGLGALATGAASVGSGGDAEGVAADAAADAALAAIRAGDADDVVALESRRSGHPSRSRAWGAAGAWRRRAWVPLAAAAAVAALLVVGRDPQPLPVSDATGRTETIAPRVSVVPPADRGAAIMETEDPNITIVWLYDREES